MKVTTDSRKIFDSIEQSWDATHVFYYRLNGDKNNTVPINIVNTVALADIRNIVQEVVIAGHLNDNYDPVFMDGVFARCFLEYLTDCSVIIGVDENGKDQYVDLNICYELIFGQNGVVKNDKIAANIVSKIRYYIDICNSIAIKEEEPVQQLGQKILDLYYILRAEAASIEDNAAEQTQILEAINNILNFKSENK